MISKDFMERPSIEDMLDYEPFRFIIKEEKFDEARLFLRNMIKEKKIFYVRVFPNLLIIKTY